MHETPKNFKELKKNPCVKQREKHVWGCVKLSDKHLRIIIQNILDFFRKIPVCYLFLFFQKKNPAFFFFFMQETEQIFRRNFWESFWN